MVKVQIKKRGKYYQYTFEIAPQDGKRKWITKSGFKTKPEAEREGLKALNEYLETGHSFKPSEISYSDYLDYWMEEYWIVIPAEQPSLDLEKLADLNEKSETLLKEEWFYGIKDEAGLKGMLGQVDNGFFGYTPYPTILHKATYFWYTISTKQMFNNGNKRTALLTSLLYLKINGFSFDILDEVKLYNISIQVANKQFSYNQLYQYILRHSYIDFEFSKRILSDKKA